MILSPSEGEEEKFTLINQNIDLDEMQGADLEFIALSKCKQAVAELSKGQPVFVEDTALCFDEFNGLPGAYIKWFVKSMGVDKIVQMLAGFSNKSAQAVTTIAYADSEGQFHTFQGITRGKIVNPRGPQTFGWDCIFQPDEGSGVTYAEMPKSEKNNISQRGRAFAKFKQFLYAPK